MHHAGIYEKFIKRLLDILLSGIVLLAFCWLYAILAVLVRVKLGSPVLFAQDRPGKDGKIFKLYKFRTMTNDTDENGKLLPDEQRLPHFGALLRGTSLDELPELWNIFKGDMSIVGPRPLLVKYLPRYTLYQMRRHDVRPGLTGWAQVHGRNAITWEERFDYDIWYTEHVCFGVDVKTVWLTILAVLKHDGITSDTSATMEEFLGTPGPNDIEVES